MVIEEKIQERFGLFKNVPRSLTREVERWLRVLETRPEAFEAAAVEHRGMLKRLYALLHIKPGHKAQTLLFEKAPEGSALGALREIAQHRNAERTAHLVRTHRLPFLVAESAFGRLTAPVALALVETMPDIELIDRLRLLGRRGLIEGEVRTALLDRLRRMKDAPIHVPYRKLESTIRIAQLDREVAGALFDLLKKPQMARLRGSTVLLLDVSLSSPREGDVVAMAAEVAHRVDEALDDEAPLHGVIFAERARLLRVKRHAGLPTWRSALSQTPNFDDLGHGTSVGAAFELLERNELHPERIIIVSDGYENRAPRMGSGLQSYTRATGKRPPLMLVQPSDGGRQLAVDLRNSDVPFSVFTLDEHRLGLDLLVETLATEQEGDVFAEIRNFPLESVA